MIVGIGTDIVSVERIKGAMEKENFMTKLFSEEERKYLDSPERVAGRWAAKEATAKALSVNLTWRDVEVLNYEDGKPYLRFAENVDFEPDLTVHLTISHEREYAVAVVIAERLDPV